MRDIYGLRVTALAAGLCLLTACVTDPYTGEKKVSKTATGAVIGGAAGAATGLVRVAAMRAASCAQVSLAALDPGRVWLCPLRRHPRWLVG